MKIIGHRGAKGLAPENTIAGLRKAQEHNVDEIEFDVRVTHDGVAVLAHDAHIHDASGSELKLADHTYEKLKAHKPDFITLEEVLATIGNTVPLLIEVKPDEPIQPIVKVIKASLTNGWQPKDFLLASFSYATLKDLHRELPEVQMVVNERWSGTIATWKARRLGTKRLSMRSWWLWRGFITPMSNRGWQLCAYTMNDVKQANKWAGYGLYGAITDYPDLFEK